MSPEVERKLAAIMFTDIVGYTALMAESEEKGLRVRRRHREVVRPLVERYLGEAIEARGDESLSVFPTALDAVNCALAIEEQLRDDPELKLHVGIHLGDLVVEDGEVSGDGVNIASRICALSEGGGICVSDEVQHSIQNQPDIEAIPLGEHALKNVGRRVGVYAVGRPGAVSVLRSARVRFWNRGRSAVVGVALAVLVLVAWRVWDQTAITPGPIRSIAVLPLENLSGDPEQEYFADGMTEALIGDLAKIGSLLVISRTSVMQYKGERKPLPEIARELGVDGIIEGTVMRDGDRVRITTQLIDGRSDTHLWSERYDRELSDVLALQSDVARAVAEQIELELTPQEDADIAGSPVDPEAHEAYLKGGYHFGVTNYPRAKEFYERAIEVDPGYAAPHARLALVYWLMHSAGAVRWKDVGPDWQAAALKAVEIDETLADGHLGYASTLLLGGDFEGAEREYLLALQLEPSSANGHRFYTLLLAWVGRLDEAFATGRRGVELDPVNPGALNNLALTHLLADQPEMAEQKALAALDLEPAFFPARFWLGVSLYVQGFPDRAIAEFQRGAEATNGGVPFVAFIARVQAAQGKPEQARELLGELLSRPPLRERSPLTFAALYLGLGLEDKALEWIERAVDERSAGIFYLKVSPNWDALRSDPRFQDLLRRIGFPES